MRRTRAIRYGIGLLTAALVAFCGYHGFTNSSGTAGGYTAAPGEANCTTCHTGGSYAAPSSVIKFTINGSTSFYYEPDSTYSIAISGTKSGINKWGFEATALKDSDNSFSGTFASVNLSVGVTSTTIAGQTRYYVTHTSGGNAGTGGRGWSFTWKAPHTNVGSITFYVTVCGANGNNLVTGDNIYGNTFQLKPLPHYPIAGFTTSPANLCEGDTVTIKDTSTRQPTSWNWTFVGGTPSSSTLQNPKVVFKVWGGHKITLVVSNAVGTAPAYSKSLYVNPTPPDTVYRVRPTEFCPGDSTILKAYLSDSYLWSTGETTQNITKKTSGNYSVVVTINGCPGKSQVVKVKEHAKPQNILTRIQGGDTICTGDTAKFNLKMNGRIEFYYNNGSLINYRGLNLVLPGLTGSSNRIYSIVYDSFGCKPDTSTIYPEVLRATLLGPTLSAGKPTTQSVTADWTSIKGAQGYEISTDSGKTWSGYTSLTHYQVPMPSNSSIALKVRAKDPSACVNGYPSTIVLTSLQCSKKNIFA